MITVLFFFNNFRLADNRSLAKAMEYEDPILPVAALNNDRFNKTWFGWSSMGPYRTQFLQETITDWSESCLKIGAKPAIFNASLTHAVTQIAEQHHIARVICPHVLGHYEATEIKDLKNWCETSAIDFETVWDWTLIDNIDLDRLSLGFSSFRKRVEKQLSVSDVVPMLSKIPGVAHSFKSQPEASLNSAPCPQAGGETAALAHLDHYIWQSKALGHYKQTRNKLMGNNTSSRLSAYLSFGCLSPRTIYKEVRRFEKMVKKNESTYWLIFELLWRDFFQFQYLKHHSNWFQYGGIQKKVGQAPPIDNDRCQAWVHGNTDNAFVNAMMNELRQTGYMSNRARQNAASYFCHDLSQDWRVGAAIFEHFLIDHDVASNIGNWMYIAGVGNSHNERVFNVNGQQDRYDNNRHYTNYWLQR